MVYTVASQLPTIHYFFVPLLVIAYIEDMATFTTLVRVYSTEYFFNGNGLGEIFIQQRFQLHSTCTSCHVPCLCRSFFLVWLSWPPSTTKSAQKLWMSCSICSLLFKVREKKSTQLATCIVCTAYYMYCIIYIAGSFLLEKCLPFRLHLSWVKFL